MRKIAAFLCFGVCATINSAFSMHLSCFSYMLQNNFAFNFGTTKFSGTVKQVDVIAMFCDIRNMANIAAQTEPNLTGILVKYYFEKITEVIKKYSGQINKYTGSLVFVVFPAKSNSAFDNALDCAMEILSIAQSLEANQIASIKCCIGIDCGIVASGLLGFGNFYEQTYIGDTINIASRLQILGDRLNTDIVISTNFFEKLSSIKQYKFEDFNYKSLKGKTEGVKVYGVSSQKQNQESNNLRGRVSRTNLIKNMTQSQIEAISEFKHINCVTMFCDIRNFTTYCEENCEHPELIFKFIQVYFSELGKIILKYCGYVQKYLGDGVLILFPSCRSGDLDMLCVNAVKCAEEFISLGEKFKLELGVGISVGMVVSIDINGSEYDFYKPLCSNILVGTPVRSCLWLEGQNKNENLKRRLLKKIIISDDVYHYLSVDYKRCFGLMLPFNGNAVAPKVRILGYTSEYATVFPSIKRRHP